MPMKSTVSVVQAKLLKENLPKLADELYQLTEKWASKRLKPSDLSERAQEIIVVLNDMHSWTETGKKDLAKLASAIIGEPVPYKSNSVRFTVGIVIVPVGNDNGHDYDLNEPCICRYVADSSTNRFVKMNGTSGNNLTTNPSLLRIATREEVGTLLQGIHSTNSLELVSILELADLLKSGAE